MTQTATPTKVPSRQTDAALLRTAAQGDEAAFVTLYRAHRLRREAKILGVMQARPDGTLDEWVTQAYDDVPPRMWPVAKRSLLAHVQRIQGMVQGN